MQLMKTRALAIGGLGALVLLVSTTALGLAGQSDPAPEAMPSAPTHEQMQQMMEAMHGEGAIERMHEAMAAAGMDAEQMMEQCAAMMAMMLHMQDMMGSMMMPGMMGRGMMPGMMGH